MFRTHNNGSFQQAWAFSNGKSTVDKLKNKKWRFKVVGFEKRRILATEKIKPFFHVSSALQRYKKFRTHNIGSLQPVWATSTGKSTVNHLKKEK